MPIESYFQLIKAVYILMYSLEKRERGKNGRWSILFGMLKDYFELKLFSK